MGILTIKFNFVLVSRYCSILAFLISISHVSCETRKNEIAVKNFRDYLRINTSHVNPDYDSAIAWIKEQAQGLDLKYNILRFSEDNAQFAVWLTWPGRNPSLQSVFLYSHIDVVAVDSEWKHDPFAAEMDADGNIFGRGAQDMKSAAVQYLEAIRNLKAKGVTPNRTVHIGFLPDEEVGGGKGIKLFVHTPEFMNLNIGFVLDEGMPTDDPNPTQFNFYYAQRQVIWPKFTAIGESGHGSLLLNNTAAEKILKVINKLMSLREIEKLRYQRNSSLQVGDITTVNLNILEGGFEANIIPPKFSATFDMRLPPYAKYNDVIKLLSDTCTEAGPNVTYEIIHTSLLPGQELPVTKLEKDAWWWTSIQKACQAMNLTIEPRVFPGTSDGQTLRNQGIPTLEFSPMYNTPMLMHARDEYLNVDVFLRGIEIYEKLIQSLAYAPPGTVDKAHPKGKSSSALMIPSYSTWICTCLVYYLSK